MATGESISSDFKDEDYYNMSHKNRGVALIFNHQNFKPPMGTRRGTEQDLDSAQRVFKKLGFDVQIHVDLTYQQIEKTIQNVANMDHSDNDCLVLCVSTHGDNNVLYASDIRYKTEEIWMPFKDCPTLAGKPKIFFIDASQGDRYEDSIEMLDEGASSYQNKQTRDASTMYANTVFIYYKEIGPMNEDSIFTQYMCEALEKHWKSEDLLTIFHKVNVRVQEIPARRNKTEIPKCVSSLTKKLFFGQFHSYEPSSKLEFLGEIKNEIDDLYYPMNHKKRGHALIFSQENFSTGHYMQKIGAHKNSKRIADIFSKIGFDVKTYKDSKLSEIEEIIGNMSEKDHSNKDCILVYITTLEVDNYFFAADQRFRQSILWDPLTQCRSLIGKPKIFIVDNEIDSSRTPNSIQDSVITLAAAQGFVAWRNTQRGSVFMQRVCEELETHHESKDLETILLGVTKRVISEFESKTLYPEMSYKRQTPSTISTLRKMICFKSKETKDSKEDLEKKISDDSDDSENDWSDDHMTDGSRSRFYNMRHKNRGLAIIFDHMNYDESDNIPPRFGTDKDSTALKRVLSDEFGFEVKIFKDRTYREIQKILDEVSILDHSHNDCLIIAVLTHGDQKTVSAYDEDYPVNELWEPFYSDTCPTLSGKPKLFFIQACRGRQIDDGVHCTDDDSEAIYEPTVQSNRYENRRIREYNNITSDILIMNATFPGFVAWRTRKGSTFIQTLCQELEANCSARDVLSVLSRVAGRVAREYKSVNTKEPRKHGKKQMPTITSLLTKEMWLTKRKKRKNVSKLFCVIALSMSCAFLFNIFRR